VIYILSPWDTRAQALVRLLKGADCRDTVVGVQLAGEPRIWSRGPFDAVINMNRMEPTRDGDVIVPTGAHSTEWFLTRADCRVGAIVHSRASLKVFDKAWLLSQAVQVGIPIPVTWTSADDIGVDDLPLFYKAAYERESGIRGLVRQAHDLPSVPAGPLIFQEYIDSSGTYGVGFLAKNGEVLVSYSHYESSSNPSTGGGGIILEPCEDKRLLEYTERLVGHLGYSGWGLAEFKYCPKRMDYVLMEINAKFWGSCELAFRNEPKFLLSLFGLTTEPQGIERMILFNGALARGPRYLTRHRRELVSSRRIHYRGWGRALVIGILPKRCRRGLVTVRSAVRAATRGTRQAINSRPTT
jgi:hypothetical protein